MCASAPATTSFRAPKPTNARSPSCPISEAGRAHLSMNAGRRARAVLRTAQAKAAYDRRAWRRCRRSSAFVRRRPTSNWSGCRTASTRTGRRISSRPCAAIEGKAPLTIIDGGVAAAACACRRRQRGRRVHGEGAARAGGPEEAGTLRALDLKGLPVGEARYLFQRTTWNGSRIPVAGGNPQRHRASRNRGERSSGAVQLLDKRWRRRIRGRHLPAQPPTPRSRCSPPPIYLSRALDPFADVRLADRAAPAEAVRNSSSRMCR